MTSYIVGVAMVVLGFVAAYIASDGAFLGLVAVNLCTFGGLLQGLFKCSRGIAEREK